MRIDPYAVFWVDLNPTRGAEMNKMRPCVVISPDEMNAFLRTVLIAPVTSRQREGYPTRVHLEHAAVTGWIVLDQIRAVDKSRLGEKICELGEAEIRAVKDILKEMLVD